MATLLQDTARRIDRLGRYASIVDNGFSVTKAHGVLRMCSGSFIVLFCTPQKGEVWLESRDDGQRLDPAFDAETGLKRLTEFEASLLLQARAKAREDVIGELVDRKIRRIVRAKTRGFKVERKKAKAKK